MLDQLRFVQGAVAKKDLVPAMTHFRIDGGRVRSFNGSMALCSPIALNIDCCPKAGPLVKAISNCEDATTISLTPTGKLSVRSGRFRALVDTIQGDTPHPEPGGDAIALDGQALMAAMRVLEPFIGTDASRPFTNGVLLHEQSAYATNNTCLVQYWLGTKVPRTMNVPRAAVRELLRINEEPIHAQADAGSITFHYTGDRWVRTQLLETNWPDLTKILDQAANPMPLDQELFVGLDKLQAMVDGASRVYMKDGALRTHEDPDEGAVYEMDLPGVGLYNIQMLGLLKGVVSSADFTRYPDPCLFFGERIRGAIVGMRM